MFFPTVTHQGPDRLGEFELLRTLDELDELDQLERRLWAARDEIDSLGRLLDASVDPDHPREEFDRADLEEMVIEARPLSRRCSGLAGGPGLHRS